MSPVSDTKPKPVGHDMSRYWRLVSVDAGPVTGTFWVSRPGWRGAFVQAVRVTLWINTRRTRGCVVTDMIAWVKGDEVDLPEHMIDPRVRADVLDRLDDVKAAVLAAARAFKWGDDDAV